MPSHLSRRALLATAAALAAVPAFAASAGRERADREAILATMKRASTFMVEEASMPAALFPGLEQQDTVAGQIALLARHFGVLLGKGSERITTGPASREVAEALGGAEGTVVSVLDRVILAIDGRPIEWRIGWCNLAGRHYHAQIA